MIKNSRNQEGKQHYINSSSRTLHRHKSYKRENMNKFQEIIICNTWQILNYLY